MKRLTEKIKQVKMINKKLKYSLGLIAAIAVINPAVVKGQSKEKGLDTISITLLTPYAPTISDANKKNDNPIMVDEIPFSPKLVYSIKTEKISSDFEIQPIKPARIKGEPLSKLYRSYLKIGYGTQSRLYGEGFLNSLRSKKHAWGIHVKHLSSAGKIKDVGNSGFSDTDFNLNGKMFLKKHTLSGGADYEHSSVHFYGFDINDTALTNLGDAVVGKNAIRQQFSLIRGNVRLLSHYRDSAAINHDIQLDYYNLMDRYGLQENSFVLTANANRYFNKEFFNVLLTYDYLDDKYYTNTDSSAIQANTIIRVNPSVSTDGKKYKFVVGIGAYIEVDALYGTSYSFYPNVYFSYNLINDILKPFVGINGRLRRNSFKTLSDENPFVLSPPRVAHDTYNSKGSIPRIKNSKHTIQFYGGFKGEFSKTSAFNVSVSRDKIDDEMFFVTDTSSRMNNRFGVVYDNIKYFNVHAEFSYHSKDRFKLMFLGDYNVYVTDYEERAWHKPELELTLSGTYNIAEKFIAKADIYLFGNQYAKEFEADGSTVKVVKLPAAVDLNLSIEYRYTKKLSLYLMLNNIAATRYYRFHNYPSQRFNLLGVVTYIL